jgi:D-ribose pyranose/furanose isomerase RbsD
MAIAGKSWSEKLNRHVREELHISEVTISTEVMLQMDSSSDLKKERRRVSKINVKIETKAMRNLGPKDQDVKIRAGEVIRTYARR